MVTTSTPILMLRHGQSTWNAQRRWQGRKDSPLTDLGRAQADATGALLASSGIEWTGIWSSPLGRTVETAGILGASIANWSLLLDEGLAEADAGEWTGKLISDIEREYPGWLDSGRRPDSFERAEAVVERTVAALGKIAGQTTGPAVVVTHSGVIRRLRSASGAVDVRVPNLGGVWVRVNQSVIGDTSLGPLAGVDVVADVDPDRDGAIRFVG